jgi:ribosomal protein S18 acetylase RimI-like enzyme
MNAPFRLRRLRESDVVALARIAAACRVFTPDEVATIEALLRESLAGDGYRVLVGTSAGQPVCFAIFGHRPLTEGAHDLYWLAVDPQRHGEGLGGKLLRRVEAQVRQAQGRLLVIETSDTPAYAPARRLYERAGYEQWGHLPELYGVGDGQVIYGKTL